VPYAAQSHNLSNCRAWREIPVQRSPGVQPSQKSRVYSYAAPADATACNVQVWEAHKHLNEGIASGEVQPLPWTVYSRDKAQDAFRFLAGGACSFAFYFEQPPLRIVGP
jgi:hypothetical protein